MKKNSRKRIKNSQKAENANGFNESENSRSSQFANFARFAHFASQQKEAGEELAKTSTIPKEVYDNLPEILKIGSSVFDDSREKDVFLTGAMGVLSGLFSTVSGLYASDEIFPNLNFFILSGAGGGKGAMKYAKLIAKPIHQAKVRFSQSVYATEQKQYLLYIPANSSSAVVIRHLDENNGSGIIFETEADTMADTMNQDWGGYSDLARKSFHHESVSYSRKKDREFIEIDKPKLSIVLSGTPDQVKSLIHSTENGLFSRIMFYAFEGSDKWRSVAPKADRLNFNVFFEELGVRVKSIYTAFIAKQFEFDLTSEQWEVLDSQFSIWLTDITTFIHKDTSSVVKRLGIVQFRLAMILSILRHYQEDKIEETKIICTDKDFKTAQLLSNTYLEHSLTMFFKLPGKSIDGFNIHLKRFYDYIPSNTIFSRSAAVREGLNLGNQERTVDLYLKKLVDMNLLTQPEYGKYYKD
jgi:hypothetical protein